MVVTMATENPSYGYKRIAGAMANLGYKVDKITVKNILERNGIDPAPIRKEGKGSWAQFIKTHMDVIAATDFFTVPVVTWHGIMNYYVLFIIDLETRKVHFAGMTCNPTEQFMKQCARQLTDESDGFLKGKKYMIHDRDTKYTEGFREILKNSGVEPLKLPARSPDLNAFAERFVLSAKSECFDNLIIFGEGGLRHAAKNYLQHYEKERNHQGLHNAIIKPATHVGQLNGEVACHERLGGLLKYYARAA